MFLTRSDYIPVGAILITRDESEIPLESWNAGELQRWSMLSLQKDAPSEKESEHRLLDPYLQDQLLRSRNLRPYSNLFQKDWIKLEFKVNAATPNQGTLRVYLLPDDVHRGIVDRSDTGLLKMRQSVLAKLNYSNLAWNGDHQSARLSNPLLVDQFSQGDEEEMSLLQLFNKIPSPNPDPEVVLDQHSRDAMYSLLESTVPGLQTKLYDYQRRSAALMLQKEICPGHVLDPRLLHVCDQDGSSWYFDPALGTTLKEPRYYDGVSGGILAEEMGSGKTIMCLALILSTRNLPAQPPEHYRAGEGPRRDKIASLADMAASCATRNSVPWRRYFDVYQKQLGEEFTHCIEALERNPGYYFLPVPAPNRIGRRRDLPLPPPKKIYLSSASLIVVPNNLLAQWKQEIQKHTDGLELLIVTKDDSVPSIEALINCDIIIFSQTGFDKLVREDSDIRQSPLSQVHFKRCIVDEGHKLGNSRISNKSNLLLGLDALHFSSRWIVTGTPSQGLFGVDNRGEALSREALESSHETENSKGNTESSVEMEKKDLERIGSITALYLKARPWANSIMDAGDTTAHWSIYLMLPKHNPKSRGRWEYLKSTINSLIIRHRLDEVANLLPPVNEKVVVLDGSYQDQLSLNVFSMMIIFNTVQSQRTDMDYFFHPKQRRSLLQLVHNLKQASFFGGSFFAFEEISKAVQTAEKFLSERKIPISDEDQKLLEQAIEIGHAAMANHIRNLSNQFHEIPVSAHGFPRAIGQSWSLDGEPGDPMCSSSSMLFALQKLIHKSGAAPEELNSLLNGKLVQEGVNERDRMLTSQSADQPPSSRDNSSQTLAGNTKLGDDTHHKIRSHGINGVQPAKETPSEIFLGPLEPTTIGSTASSKLSYLVDSIIQYQDEEKIIVFYENDNAAWYLAGMLDVLQVQYLIYAKGLRTERRAQYVNTFHHNPKFRVLLMDISQAAFGLDMREASRIYFINPVLNPQVEAQAIGRVRRISQQKPVSVETLVLKNSIEEVILDRKQHMSQAEHRRVKSILDIRPIYDWIKSAKIIPLPKDKTNKVTQMTPLRKPQYVFGRGFGRTMHPDDGIILNEGGETETCTIEYNQSGESADVLKREYDVGPGAECQVQTEANGLLTKTRDLAARPARRVRFTVGSDDE